MPIQLILATCYKCMQVKLLMCIIITALKLFRLSMVSMTIYDYWKSFWYNELNFCHNYKQILAAVSFASTLYEHLADESLVPTGTLTCERNSNFKLNYGYHPKQITHHWWSILSFFIHHTFRYTVWWLPDRSIGRSIVWLILLRQCSG